MKRSYLLLISVMFVSSAWALNPSREYAVTPDEYAMEYEAVTIKTEDDVNLKGWFFKPAETTFKCVIMSHDGDGNMADDLEIVAQFLTLGYHVLTYDYRGYGESDEFKISSKMFIYPHFYKDISAAINFCRKYHAKLANLHLYGQGIGAGLSLTAGANNTLIRKVMSDGPYVSFDQVKKQYREKRGMEMMVPLAYNKRQLEPFYALQDKGDHLYGILFIVGENEVISGPDDVKELTKLQKKVSSTYEVDGSLNKDNFVTDKEAYFEKIRWFLE